MRRYTLFATALLLVFATSLQAQKDDDGPKTISEVIENCKAYDGYFNFYWHEEKGKLYLEVSNWNTEFLYVNSLSGGVGSNDIGLDRNQLGNERIVKFVRSGPKVLLLQPNYQYRAVSDNPDERSAVSSAFAQSVIWGFEAVAAEDDRVLIDLTPFLLADAHDVAGRLKSNNQGTYKLDAGRSMINLERTKNFPQNSEFDALVTLTGDAQGREIRSVTPTPDIVTVFQHHSFIQLPDDNYEPRTYDPRSGYFPMSYYDYATPIDQPLVKRFITRHRLEKKDPSAALSDPVEPIIYYLDRGAPEPIRSALLEGARWWNQAYEAAGYRNAFRVELLPEDADPMDVRYNVINWTHRSTRGWSYGSSVVDPRTGEIIKGHVLLGSLRVRQDFLIAQGLISAYENGEEADPRMLEMALARLRQLSCHEVGHTLGLAHNFAASYNDRASVMDYPHPYILIDANGEVNFDQAYDTGIGEWDKRTILYGYQDFPGNVDEEEALQSILTENDEMGLIYLSDPDARPGYTAHPLAHLWDNGQSAADELNRLSLLRRKALINFSEANIPVGAPMSTLESVLVPLYLMHRYQAEATAKVVGGLQYSYSVRGSANAEVSPVPAQQQRTALEALLGTLEPGFLEIPEHIIRLIPPPAYGYSRDREMFKIYTGNTFDPLAAAEAAADHTLSLLLMPERLARLEEQSARHPNTLSALEVIDELQQATERWTNSSEGYHAAIAQVVEKRFVFHLIRLAADRDVQPQVAGAAWAKLEDIQNRLTNRLASAFTGSGSSPKRSHLVFLRQQIQAFLQRPEAFDIPKAPSLPDGSPIGCE
ncbi:MAG: zinc-dependent metalloprotease [Lewinella sp.]|nr:zinc-dependent metalloprotease [Lewinella sp.]